MIDIFEHYNISIATGLVKPKTTSLFFDKIWLPKIENIIFDDEIPSEILFTPEDYEYYSKMFLFSSNLQCSIINDNNSIQMIDYISQGNDPLNYYDISFTSSYHRNASLKKITDNIRLRYGINITPIYINETAFNSDFYSNNENIYDNIHPIVIAMQNIPSIIEKELKWDQVLNFKKDKHSVQKLHRFRNWAQLSMNNLTKDEIVCTYEKACDDYKQALHKHGILTTIGSISLILNSTTTVIESIGSNTYQQLATGISIASGLSVFTLTQCYNYFETKKSPIAYIYDILKII